MIKIDISDLTNNLGLEADFNKQTYVDAAKKTALDIHAGLVMVTPVDTGRARNGWQLSADGNGGMTVENQVPYIEALNTGHSKQAPAGFIEQVIDDATRR